MKIVDMRRKLPASVNKMLDSHPSEYPLALELAKNYLKPLNWVELKHWLINTATHDWFVKGEDPFESARKAVYFMKLIQDINYK